MKPDLLKGVRVVDFTTHVAAPACTRIMADWGADVIKVEGAGGEAWRVFGASLNTPIDGDKNPLFQLENANKRGIGLNLKTLEGKEAMLKLIGTADVFVTNVRMKSLEKLGLDYETLAPMFPKLVWGHVSGYGLYGKEAARPGFDIVAYWARGGMMCDAPPKGHPPLSVPTGVGDHTTALALLGGICAALFKAKQTGEGEKVCVSLYNTAIYANGLMVVSTQYDDIFPKGRYEPSTPLMNSYCSKDGEWFTLALLNYEAMYPRLCKVLEMESFANDQRYNSVAAVKQAGNTEALCRILEDAFAKYDSTYLDEEMTKQDLTFERCRHFHEISKDAQAHANHYFNEVIYADGTTVQLPTTPVHFKENEAMPCSLAPRLGQHNHEVLKELGYTEEQIMHMESNGAAVKE